MADNPKLTRLAGFCAAHSHTLVIRKPAIFCHCAPRHPNHRSPEAAHMLVPEMNSGSDPALTLFPLIF